MLAMATVDMAMATVTGATIDRIITTVMVGIQSVGAIGRAGGGDVVDRALIRSIRV
jgi:hypothetical protein